MSTTEQWTVEQARKYFNSPKGKLVGKKKKSKGAKQKADIEIILMLLGFKMVPIDPKLNYEHYERMQYVKELEFSHTRKFRFDWAIPRLKVAIEYEGVFGGKSRHTTVGGFTTDTDKYNLAGKEGWTVLRYTAKNYRTLTADLTEILKPKTI